MWKFHWKFSTPRRAAAARGVSGSPGGVTSPSPPRSGQYLREPPRRYLIRPEAHQAPGRTLSSGASGPQAPWTPQPRRGLDHPGPSMPSKFPGSTVDHTEKAGSQAILFIYLCSPSPSSATPPGSSSSTSFRCMGYLDTKMLAV